MQNKSYITFSFAGLITSFVSNIYSILGVLLFGWGAGVIIYTFLIELIIASVFTIAFMISSQRLHDPYFSKLNSHWVKSYPTKAKLILNMVPFIGIFTTLITVLTIWISWVLVGNEVAAHMNELIYFTLITFIGNALSFALFKINKSNQESYVSHVFRTFMTRKVLPLFVGMFILVGLFKYLSVYVIVLIGLKMVNDWLIYYNENKIAG